MNNETWQHGEITEATPTKMKYIEGQPIAFSGQKAFIETYGDEVWCEFCDTFPMDQWIRVKDAALELETVNRYADPRLYLISVLKNVLADYNSRPEAYENEPPLIQRGKLMIEVKLPGLVVTTQH